MSGIYYYTEYRPILSGVIALVISAIIFYFLSATKVLDPILVFICSFLIGVIVAVISSIFIAKVLSDYLFKTNLPDWKTVYETEDYDTDEKYKLLGKIEDAEKLKDIRTNMLLYLLAVISTIIFTYILSIIMNYLRLDVFVLYVLTAISVYIWVFCIALMVTTQQRSYVR